MRICSVCREAFDPPVEPVAGNRAWCPACNEVAKGMKAASGERRGGGQGKQPTPDFILERIELYRLHVEAGGRLEDLWQNMRLREAA